MNIIDSTYELYATLNTGGTVNLTSLIQQMSWGDPVGEIAAKANITLAQSKAASGYLSDMMKLCTRLTIKANNKNVFEGTVWDWEYSSARERNITLTAYDPLIYATKSKDNNYYSAGKSTKEIVADICAKWGISLEYKWGGISNQKTVYNNKTVADQILQTISEAEKQLGKTNCTIFKSGKLLVDYKGSNTDVYVFEATTNSISTNNRLTLDGLVTKVIIVGKEDNDGRTPVEKTVLGKTEYGTLQEIVSRTGDTTLADATKEATELLAERGQPKEYITVETVDVPTIRKGEKVKINGGNLSNYFFVKGLTHQAHERKMTMELERIPVVTVKAATYADGGGSGFKKGDSVILNGPVYVDSYGNGKGKTFTNYKSTITIVVDKNRACPYHIGSIGWVYPNEITKG